MTPKQQQCLRHIAAYMNTYGVAPSYAEIAELMGISSPATVHFHVKALISLGELTAEGNGYRRIAITHPEKFPPSEVYVALREKAPLRKTKLSRQEASQYLLERHCVRRTVHTLAKLACRGDGPRFRYVGQNVQYEASDLDAYAISITTPVGNSTLSRPGRRVDTARQAGLEEIARAIYEAAPSVSTASWGELLPEHPQERNRALHQARAVIALAKKGRAA